MKMSGTIRCATRADVANRAGVSVTVVSYVMNNNRYVDKEKRERVLKAARECGTIVTVEEHSIIGGLGEAVCSLISENCPVPVKRIGVNDEFGHSGPFATLLKTFGLCAENIVSQTRLLL